MDAVKEGAGRITGTAQTDDTLVIFLNGKEVGYGEISEDGAFQYYFIATEVTITPGSI
ncbi:hypothetical protein SFB97_08795 [Enterococcus hirae]|uniref:hypothetical protein n=1 Tax=Enterococcus hirae TaxID=1354 RepID=UPI003919D665